MRIAVIVNLRAHALRHKPALVDRIRALGDSVVDFHPTSSLAELAEVCLRIAGDGVERVVLAGGDGTLMAGVTELSRAFGARQLPELVVAPGGTVATVARNWGQRRGLLPTVRAALEQHGGTVRERPSLRVVSEGEERLGFIFGTGLVARFFERYYASGAGGYPVAAKIVARVFVGSFVSDAYSRSVLEPMSCTLEVDGKLLEPSAFSLICCSVVRDLGLHLLVTHRAGEDPERPHLVASALSTRALGPQAPRVLAGKPLSGRHNFDDLVQRFTLSFPGDAGPYVLDGDVFRARRVSVSAGPRIRLRTY